jgi:hypothetical protein
MKFIYKWIPRLYMLSSLFWSIGYLIWKYTSTEVVEETHTTMSIPILIVLALLIAIVTIGGAVVVLLSYWEHIKKDKLSFITFAPIALLMLGVIVLSKLGIHKLKVLIQINVAQFLTDLSTYNGSMTVLLWILGSGFVIGAIGFAYEKISA